MYSEIIILIKKDYTSDETAEIVEVESIREVFVKVLSIGQSEFYQAMANGLKPEIKFELADYYEYEDQKELIYHNVKYQVLRTYRKGLRALEITCYGGVNIADA